MSSENARRKRQVARLASKKRSKTFTGCWTCRSRSVKCGEEKPTCRRCRNSGLSCDGYGVRLIWPGQHGAKNAQRRNCYDHSLFAYPVFSEEAVDLALSEIDAASDPEHLTVGLFSVFRQQQGSESTVLRDFYTDFELEDGGCFPIGDEGMFPEEQYLVPRLATSSSWLGTMRSDDDDGNDPSTPEQRKARRDLRQGSHITSRTTFLNLSPSTQTSIERQLMNYWVTFLSGLMTPTPRQDNAFQDIFTSLAVSAMGMSQSSPAHSAFLHSLYAFAAFSRARLCSSGETECVIGNQHLKWSLQQLNQSLTTCELEAQQAILATILALSFIPAFTGETSDWRVHFSGGIAWLKTTEKRAWRYSRNMSTLYQIFVCLEELRPAYGAVAKGFGPPDFSFRQPSIAPETLNGDGDMEWYLDGIFGVTRPIMEIIHEINRHVFSGVQLSPAELDKLELEIYRNDPKWLQSQFSGPDEHCRELAWRHARAFYYACHIYLVCSLRKQPPRSVTYFVEQGIKQIEAFSRLEAGLNISGLMWPCFIIACETEDPDLRLRIKSYFDKRECWGIANVTAAKEVILTVWNRRDKAVQGTCVLWQEVMAEMGIDIILS